MKRLQMLFSFIVFTIPIGTSCSDDSNNYPSSDTLKLDKASPKDSSAKLDQASSDKGGAKDHGSSNADQGTTDASPGCTAGFAGCTSFEDKTADNAITIEFGGTTGTAYSPKCVKIKKDTKVTLKGNFGFHPLAQACGPSDVITNGSGTEIQFTFTAAGLFGYYCTAHGTVSGSGMAGAIEVVP
jgi:plastocyanin